MTTDKVSRGKPVRAFLSDVINVPHFILRLNALILILLSGVHPDGYSRTVTKLGEPQAFSKLMAMLKQDKIYSGPCFGFVNEANDDKLAKTDEDIAFYVYAIREQHGDGCPGDPNTSPVIARFRIARSTGRIEWLDSVNDKWKPYSMFLKQRAK